MVEEKIPADVLPVLKECNASDNIIKLPPRQLNRQLYERVNKVLEGLGASWDRKLKCHLMAPDQDAALLLADAIAFGIYPKVNPYLFYETPSGIAFSMAIAGLHYARHDLTENDLFLEPSAGRGALVRAMIEAKRIYAGWTPSDLLAIEIDNSHCSTLTKVATEFGGDIHVRCGHDFLDMKPERKAAVILMNPPFRNNLAATHVVHALKFLKPGGALVALLPVSLQFNTAKIWTALRHTALEVKTLPEDAFVAQGTAVKTCVAVWGMGRDGLLIEGPANG